MSTKELNILIVLLCLLLGTITAINKVYDNLENQIPASENK